MIHRIPDQSNWPSDKIDSVINDDALRVLSGLPSSCIALAVTSPPYWNTVDYGVDGQLGQTTYKEYLDQLVEIWRETARVLIPNGKLAIVAPIMPISKKIIGNQHTRHLKNIGSDIEHTILSEVPSLKRYSLFIWKKQTTTKMFGSYPFPPNLYEDNTIEFIHVYVKDGSPPSIPKQVKMGSKLTQEEWLNLTMQVWPIYPEDVKRAGGHPCPFPVVLPQRLCLMYTFKSDSRDQFAGDIVLDMFNGTGATCIAAKATRRRYIGIDLNPDYCEIAKSRLKLEPIDPKGIMLSSISVRRPKTSSQLALFVEENEI